MRLGLPQRGLLVMTLLLAGLVLASQGLWIQGKAQLAQLLLEHAWQRTLEDGENHKPWPWADHWPIAELIGPSPDQRLIVLAGDSGAVLAFAPGHNPHSGLPGEARTSIISGHRDTHFRWLKNALAGQLVQVRSSKATQTYRIRDRQIVDSRKHRIALADIPELKLVTCWPFDTLRSGGPLRLIVSAEPI
ncbi:MAG: class GN sortase [Oceanococcus sp.]